MRLKFLAGVITIASWFLPQAALANDFFTNKISLAGTVLVEGSNVLASSEAGEPLHSGQPGGKSVWWSWTASHNSMVTISTVGSSFDTLLAVYTGSSLPTLVEVASNDDASFVDTTSLVRFSATAGTVYHIAVDGINLDELGADEGDIRLSILDNDDFADRLSLQGTNVTINGHNVAATSQPAEPNHAGQVPTHTVWWSWTAPGSGALALTLSGDNTATGSGVFYKRLAVYTGSSLNALTLVGSHGSTFTLTNQLQMHVDAGLTYQIAADGVAEATARLRLDLLFTSAPVNDRFDDRTLLTTNGPVTGSNFGASKEPGEPSHAGDSGGNSVWWSWTAPSNGTVALAVSGTIHSKLLAVYTGTAVGSLTPVRSHLSADPTNHLSFEVVEGTAYAIAVDGLNGQTGTILLDLQFRTGPANNSFADRWPLTGANVTVAGANIGANAEPAEPNHGGYAAQRSVWWSWTAPANGSVTITVHGDNVSSGGGPFYKLIGVYTGDSLAALTTNRLSSGLTLTNRVIFDVSAGATYQIAVDGHNGASGLFTLALAFTEAPPNDQFSERISLAGPVVNVSAVNIGASKQAGESNHAGPGGRSVWWSWSAPASGTVVITTAGSSFNTLLAVYRGTALGSLTAVASNNDFGGQTSQVTFNATAGTIYQIAVDGLLGEAGQIHLMITQRGPAELSAPARQEDGVFQFSFAGQANTTYLMEASTNLTDWILLTTITNAATNPRISDPDAAHLPLRFYRARVQP